MLLIYRKEERGKTYNMFDVKTHRTVTQKKNCPKYKNSELEDLKATIRSIVRFTGDSFQVRNEKGNILYDPFYDDALIPNHEAHVRPGLPEIWISPTGTVGKGTHAQMRKIAAYFLKDAQTSKPDLSYYPIYKEFKKQVKPKGQIQSCMWEPNNMLFEFYPGDVAYMIAPKTKYK